MTRAAVVGACRALLQACIEKAPGDEATEAQGVVAWAIEEVLLQERQDGNEVLLRTLALRSV